MHYNKTLITSLVAAVLWGPCALPAAETAPTLPQPNLPQPSAATTRLPEGGSVDLFVPLFKSRIVNVASAAHRVSVGSPDIADIVVISPTQLYVLGKDIGTTNVLLWDTNNHLVGTISVEVQHDLEDLKRKLAEILPGQAIEVRSTQRSIVLSGRVSDVEKMNAAVRIAEAYRQQIQTAVNAEVFKQQTNSQRPDKSVGEVINLMEVGHGGGRSSAGHAGGEGSRDPADRAAQSAGAVQRLPQRQRVELGWSQRWRDISPLQGWARPAAPGLWTWQRQHSPA
jgi:Flp pilus assembly secretin CpaC